jgi:hypothetical protein
MNEIETLRAYRSEVSGPTPESAEAARSRLIEAIERELADRDRAWKATTRDRLVTDPAPTPRHRIRPRFAIAAVLILVAIGVSLGLSLGGSSSGPAPALAIEKTPKWITLRLTDPTAPDPQMNTELADAGIDRVRVYSVPGPPRAVGTWAGFLELGDRCQGGVSLFGYSVDVPPSTPFNHTNHHGGQDQFRLTLPKHTGAALDPVTGTPYSKSTVRLHADSIDDPRNALKVLVPIRPRNPNDPPTAHDFGTDQLIALGGQFARYGEAIQAGQTSCADLGLKP